MAPRPSEESRAPGLFVACIVFSVLATFAVSARFFSRHVKNLVFGSDDWTIFIALLLQWTLFGLILHTIYLGTGQHIDQISEADTIRFKQDLYAINLVYVATPPVIKISIILLYKRIFTLPKFLLYANAIGGAMILWLVIMFFMGIFNCTPVAKYWEPDLAGSCISFRDYSIGYAVLNMLTDVIILTLPLPILWNLQTSIQQKILLTVVFTAGSAACVVSLLRLLKSILYISDPDFTWAFAPAFLWTMAEPSVGIICASLPTFKPLLNWVVGKTRGGRQRLEGGRSLESLPRPGGGGSRKPDTGSDAEASAGRPSHDHPGNVYASQKNAKRMSVEAAAIEEEIEAEMHGRSAERRSRL